MDGVIHGVIDAPTAWLSTDALAADLARYGAEATTVGPAVDHPGRLLVEFVHASHDQAVAALEHAKAACR